MPFKLLSHYTHWLLNRIKNGETDRNQLNKYRHFSHILKHWSVKRCDKTATNSSRQGNLCSKICSDNNGSESWWKFCKHYSIKAAGGSIKTYLNKKTSTFNPASSIDFTLIQRYSSWGCIKLCLYVYVHMVAYPQNKENYPSYAIWIIDKAVGRIIR